MDEIKYYSISEFAEIVGVSRQSVYKALSTKLSTYVVNQGDRKMLRAEALCEYNCQPSVNQTVNLVDSSVDTQSGTENEFLYELLKKELDHKNKLIEDLQNELSEERKHSREQSERIAVLASQAQYLQLEQKIDNLEIVTDVQEKPKEKRGLWRKIFKF